MVFDQQLINNLSTLQNLWFPIFITNKNNGKSYNNVSVGYKMDLKEGQQITAPFFIRFRRMAKKFSSLHPDISNINGRGS
jgi:hypothetical protein